MSAAFELQTTTSVDDGAVLSKATGRAAERLGLSGAALARVLGVSEATVSRLLRGAWTLTPDSKPAQLAALVVRLYRSLNALVGNDDRQAVAWMNSPNQALHGSPATLIETPQGLVQTLQYLDAMRAAS